MMSALRRPLRLSDRDTRAGHRQADCRPYPCKPENVEYGCAHSPSLCATGIMAEDNLKSLCRVLKSFETKRSAVFSCSIDYLTPDGSTARIDCEAANQPCAPAHGDTRGG